MRTRFGVVPASLFGSGLDADAIVVACALSTFADRNGWCWPSMNTIASMVKRSRPWVVATIPKLEKAGVLKVVKGEPGQGHRYQLQFDTHLGEPDPVRMPEETHQPADTPRQPTDTPCQPADTNTTKNNTKNTTKEHSHAAAHANGSRLASDWEAGDYEYAYARQFGYCDAEIARISENFRDYWIAQPGARGRKSDWHATWRTWVRREAERRSVRPADRGATATEERRARIAGGLALFEARTGKA